LAASFSDLYSPSPGTYKLPEKLKPYIMCGQLFSCYNTQ
jgi:hypothetical protein